MAYVNFNRKKKSSEATTNGTVYFTTDTQAIKLDGKQYGVSVIGDTMTGPLKIIYTNPTLTIGSSTIMYNSSTGCLEIKA